MSVRISWMCRVLVVVVTMQGGALAQQTVCQYLPEGEPIFSVKDLSEFDNAVALTPAQSEAALERFQPSRSE